VDGTLVVHSGGPQAFLLVFFSRAAEIFDFCNIILKSILKIENIKQNKKIKNKKWELIKKRDLNRKKKKHLETTTFIHLLFIQLTRVIHP